MSRYSRTHVASNTLLAQLKTRVAQDCANLAELLADIAEVDERKLYADAAYPSMHAYCVGELHMSEDVASQRIHSARAARRFPVIFELVAQGKLHLSGVSLLAPHLTERNVGELLAEATHKTKASIELIVARRFPQADVAARIVPIPAQVSANTSSEHAPGHVVSSQLQPSVSIQEPSASVPEHSEALLATPALAPEPRPRVRPLAPERFGIEFTFGQSAHDKLRRAQELLGFQVPSGDLAAVFERALDALIPQLEKARFKATSRPRAAKPATPESRNIPAHVQRAVWKRDGGRCTFVGEHGRRCEERRGLHFDHIVPAARGGESSISNVRLLCPTHNQLEAERRFGHAFMRGKRQAAS